MEKLKTAVNYNSINNLDRSGVAFCRRVPQVCIGSQTKSVQTQIDTITSVTIERFTNFLNDEKAAAFSRTIDIILTEYSCLETDSNTLFVKFIMEKKFKFYLVAFFALLFFFFEKLLLHMREAFPRSVATSNAGIAIIR